MALDNSMVTATFIPQGKIDATDRRQIEAQNEDRSRTTKEELDDIKRTHYKEKKKKEQRIMLQLPFKSKTEAKDFLVMEYLHGVSNILISLL